MQPLILQSTRTELQVRFGDTDMLGHINNLSYAAYCEVGRAHFFNNLAGDVPWSVMAHMELDFQREAHMGDRLSVLTSVESLGNTSMVLRQDVLRENDSPQGHECVVSTRAVLVFIDRATRTKMATPAHWKIPSDETPIHTVEFTRLKGE